MRKKDGRGREERYKGASAHYILFPRCRRPIKRFADVLRKYRNWIERERWKETRGIYLFVLGCNFDSYFAN